MSSGRKNKAIESSEVELEVQGYELWMERIRDDCTFCRRIELTKSEEYGFIFCPYCGRNLQEVDYEINGD